MAPESMTTKQGVNFTTKQAPENGHPRSGSFAITPHPDCCHLALMAVQGGLAPESGPPVGRMCRASRLTSATHLLL